MNNLIFFAGILVIIIFHISPGTAIVGGQKAQATPPDDSVVFVNRRGKSARILGTRDPKRYSFKGLRYAQSPTGPLRFQVSNLIISLLFGSYRDYNLDFPK